MSVTRNKGLVTHGRHNNSQNQHMHKRQGAGCVVRPQDHTQQWKKDQMIVHETKTLHQSEEHLEMTKLTVDQLQEERNEE
ncbi:hypothetical protein FRX31_025375 [Thalictrum thalictroides]|uniref:Uncharacterized protein n=1 Tax=Thalictrum thalictroides TaxID=46969 RepID=A0A7J6VK93_THATH|nr:hypothetical protein FRX31_025375 [Thalictrum thalictroides]